MASGPLALMDNTKKVKVIFEQVWWVLNGIEIGPKLYIMKNSDEVVVFTPKRQKSESFSIVDHNLGNIWQPYLSTRLRA